MVSWDILLPAAISALAGVCGAVVGGGATVLAAVLAVRHESSRERAERRRERRETRLDEVRKFMAACLDFADLVCTPYQLEAESTWGDSDWQWWAQTMGELEERFQGLPAGGSSIVVYLDDEEVMTVLRKMARLTARIWVWSRFPGRGLAIPSEVVQRRDELRQLASEAQARIEELVEKSG